ncbi:hypothetical protein ACQPXT_39395 [Streptomyces sp. CA-100214]
MESEVIAALVGVPTVLVTAAAAWAAGRAQARGAYHGPVDAARRATQRDAYASLYQAGERFRAAWMQAEQRNATALRRGDIVFEEQVDLEDTVVRVRLEGPEALATSAAHLQDLADKLAHPDVFLDPPDVAGQLTEALYEFNAGLEAFLNQARRYLNGGPTR